MGWGSWWCGECMLLCTLFALYKLKLHSWLIMEHYEPAVQCTWAHYLSYFSLSSSVHLSVCNSSRSFERTPTYLIVLRCMSFWVSVCLFSMAPSWRWCTSVLHILATLAWYKWPHLFFYHRIFVRALYLRCFCYFITLTSKSGRKKSVGLHREWERDCGAIMGRTPSFHKSQLANLKFRSLLHPNIIFYTNICCTQ